MIGWDMTYLPCGRTWLQPQYVDAVDWWLRRGPCGFVATVAADAVALACQRRLLRLRGKSLHLGNIRQHNRSKNHFRARAACDDSLAESPEAGFDAASTNVGIGHQSLNGMSHRKAAFLE